MMNRCGKGWVLGLLVVAVCCMSGCATSRKRMANREWIDLFGPSSDPDPEMMYDEERLAQDTRTFLAVREELRELEGELSTMRRTMVHRSTPYITTRQNQAAEFTMLRYGNARGALWEIVNYYRERCGVDDVTHYGGAVLAMSAGLHLAYHSSHGVALFCDESEIVKLINSPHPRLNLPGGMYDHLFDSVTSPEHIEQLEVLWYLFCMALVNPESELSRIREEDTVYGELIREMDRLHAGLRVKTQYILYTQGIFHSGLENRLRHSHIAKVGDAIADGVAAGLYSTRGVLFRDVARIKRPGADLVKFSDEQVAEFKALLQPGDIALTFTGGYMSNVFLPGKFKHGITYIGSAEQRREAGLSDVFLGERAVSPQQAEELLAHMQCSELASGEKVDVIEAVAEGVILSSLEKLLATHVNRIVVIRPRLSWEEQRDQLLALLQYVGAPYDFKFDFVDDRRQCCTELIYRTINGKGGVNFDLVKLKGMWILAADDLLRYALKGNSPAFEFVLLADRVPDDPEFNARIRTGAEGQRALYELMELSLPE